MELAQIFRRRAWRLIPLVQSASVPASAESDRLVAYVTIEAVNAWASFSRAFYISCATRAYTASGSRVTSKMPGIKTSHDALLEAIKKFKGYKNKNPPFRRRDEPSWHRVNNLVTLANHLGLSNLGVITTAFGYSTHAFDCLPELRNFFAHRNADTCRACHSLAASVAVPPSRRPVDILLHRNYSRPMNVLSEWISDMSLVADRLVQ